jgi:hypothetical protein
LSVKSGKTSLALFRLFRPAGFGIWTYVLCEKRFLKSSFKGSGGIGQFTLNLISDDCFLPARLQAGFKQNRKELNFAPVAPTSAHTESIFSVVFEIWLIPKKYERFNSVPPQAGGGVRPELRN